MAEAHTAARTRTRTRRKAWVFAFSAALPAACVSPRGDDRPHDLPTPAEVTRPPDTPEAFLRALVPTIGRGLHIAYDLKGPRGYTGTLDLFARPGGFVHQHWRLSHPDGSAIEGSWAQTPEFQWTHGSGHPPIAVGRPLGALARAFTALAPEPRRRVMATLRAWHQAVEEDRRERPGPGERHLGRTCRAAEIVGHRYCVWEEAGVVLSFVSETLRLEARSIETDVEVDLARFEVPEGARRSTDAPPAFDAEAALARMAEGNPAAVARLLRPAIPLAIDGS